MAYKATAFRPNLACCCCAFKEILERLSMTFTANGKRQTAKMKLLLSFLSCVHSRVKLFVFAMNSRRRYSTFACFIYGLKVKNSKSEVAFAVCRLPLTSCLTSLLSVIVTRDQAGSTDRGRPIPSKFSAFFFYRIR